MGYTYEDVVEEAKKSGVYENFSQQDLVAAQKSPEYGMAMVGLFKNLGTATTEEQKVLTTDYINRMRKNYGVSDVAAGSAETTGTEGTRLLVPGQSGTLDVNDAGTYTAVINDLINQPAFSYDHTKDPTYAQYESAYRREGDRAVANVLAQAAAMTGGIPSSYAISAAQQTGNNYAAALADMIPTLRQNAYSEYLKNYEMKRAIAAAMQGKSELTTESEKNVGEVITGIVEGIKEGVTNGIGWLQGLFGKGGNGTEGSEAGEDRPDPTILNENGDGWIKVGERKFKYLELQKLVDSGAVRVYYNEANNTIRYELVPFTTPGTPLRRKALETAAKPNS